MIGEVSKSGSYMAPRYEDFVEEKVFRAEDVENDKAFLENKVKKKLRLNEQKYEKLSTQLGVENIENSRDLERDVALQFAFDVLYEDADDLQLVSVVPTLEYDDFVNHVDLVCTIKNRLTDDKPISFLLDATYNPDDEKQFEKFHWLHPKHKQAGPDDTALLGLGRVKYFKDTSAARERRPPVRRAGRIDIAPRFVVGYQPDPCIDQTPEGDDKKRLCLLTQLTEQSAGILRRIDQKYPDIKKAPGDIQKVAKELATLDKYFGRAKNLFLKDLRERSVEMSEMPADKNYGNPTGYYDSVQRYLRSGEDLAQMAISSSIDSFYPQK